MYAFAIHGHCERRTNEYNLLFFLFGWENAIFLFVVKSYWALYFCEIISNYNISSRLFSLRFSCTGMLLGDFICKTLHTILPIKFLQQRIFMYKEYKWQRNKKYIRAMSTVIYFVCRHILGVEDRFLENYVNCVPPTASPYSFTLYNL